MDTTETKHLPVKLKQDEVMDYGRDLAKASQDLRETQERKKDVTSDFKAQEAKCEAEISQLSRKISTGEEYRDIECTWAYDWEGGTKTLSRDDTGEVVQRVAISEYERQQRLDIE